MNWEEYEMSKLDAHLREIEIAEMESIRAIAEFGTDWEEMEEHGTRFLTSRDFDLSDSESDALTAADWDSLRHDTFTEYRGMGE